MRLLLLLKPPYFLFCCAFFIAATAHATDSTTTWKDLLPTFKARELKGDWLTPSLNGNLIKQLEIFDFRPDTVNVGMYTNTFQKPETLNFSDSQLLAQVIRTKLSNPSGNGYSLLMIIEGFWVSGTRPFFQEKVGSRKRKVFVSKAVCKMDIFLENDGRYLPLVKVDTILRSKKSVVNGGDDLVETALETVYGKTSEALAGKKYETRKWQERQVILDYYNKRRHVIAETITPNGVFASFEQFKNRRPQTDKFAIRRVDDGTLALFMVDEKGEEIFTRDAWGAYDGTDFYIMENGLLFKLYKQGNSYYWFGLKEYDQKTYGAPAVVPLGGGWLAVGLEPVSPKVKIKLSPKLLDIHTGKEF